jgi:hypothetical protein
VSAGGVLAVACLLILLVPALHQWQRDQPNGTRTTASLLDDAGAAFGDYRPAVLVLQQAVGGEGRASRSEIAHALRLTRQAATVSIHTALLRDAAAAQIGQLAAPVAAARAELRHVDGDIAPYVPDLAQVMISAGDLPGARALLSSDLAAQVAARSFAPDAAGELAMWARSLGRGAQYACLLDGVSKLGGQALVSGLPRPVAACRTPADQASAG